MKKYCLLIAVIIVALCCVFAACAEEEIPKGWTKEETHFCFYENGVKLTGHQTIYDNEFDFTDEGYLKSNGQIQQIIYYGYVYLDANNEIVTGWQNIDGDTYYFAPEDGLAAAYSFIAGRGYSYEINGVRYAFAEDGKLVKNGWVHDVYGDSNGRTLTGYQKLGDDYYLFDEIGCALHGFQEIDGELYYFNIWPEDYHAKHLGWDKIDGHLYYCDPQTGVVQTSPRTIDGRQYNFDKDGRMIHDGDILVRFDEYNLCGYDANDELISGWRVIDGETYNFWSGYAHTDLAYIDDDYYYFDDEGRLQRDKLIWTKSFYFAMSEDLYLYYFDQDGKGVLGWQTINGSEYYFDSWYGACTGHQYINMNGYFFDEEGRMQKNCFQKCIRVYWEGLEYLYYFGLDGKQLVGWQTIDGDTYYFDYHYGAQTGTVTIDGETYHFTEEGKLIVSSETTTPEENEQKITGWITDQEEDGTERKYYYDEDGKQVNGWLTYNNERYYLWPYMIKGLYYNVQENASYYFDDNGKMQTGWITDKDEDGVEKRYYFGEDGKQVKGWLTLGNDKYYLNPEMKTGSWMVLGENGGDYFFDEETGKMRTGWITTKVGTIYYHGPDGQRLEGLQVIDGNLYFFTGPMGAKTHFTCYEKSDGNDDYYCFGSDGKAKIGWAQEEDDWYYCGSDWKCVKGWLTQGNDTYYLTPKRLENGTFRLEKDGKEDDFVFDKDGKLLGRKSELEAKPSEKPTDPVNPTSPPTPTPTPIPVTSPTPTPEPKPTDKVEAFVTRCYSIILGRKPDAAGFADWTKALQGKTKTASEIIYGFVGSNEFKNKNYSCSDVVEILYKAMLGRGSDMKGKEYWVTKLEDGQPVAVVINGFCASNEFQRICKEYGITPGSVKVDSANEAGNSNNGEENPRILTSARRTIKKEKAEEFVRRCYKLILGREADQSGLDNWVEILTSGQMTPEQVANSFFSSAEFTNRNLDSESLVKTLYRVYLNRDADQEGLAAWTEKLNNGTTLQELLKSFSKTSEFKAIISSMID